MYELLDGMPVDGHFLLLWTYNGKVWSETFTHRDGGWRRYITESDDYSDIVNPYNSVPRDGENVQFLVVQ